MPQAELLAAGVGDAIVDSGEAATDNNDFPTVVGLQPSQKSIGELVIDPSAFAGDDDSQGRILAE
jgi:hypothetical protein